MTSPQPPSGPQAHAGAGEADLAGVIRRWYDIAYATGQTPQKRAWVRTAIQQADQATADAAARDGGPAIGRDGGWFRRAVEVYERLRASGQQNRPAPGPPATVPAPRCAADPETIRAWLASASAERPEETVAESLGIYEDFHVGSDLLSGQMDGLIYAAQEAGVFGVPGHQVELWHVADNEHIVDGHLLTIDRPDGARLASHHLEPADLVDPHQRGIDAAVSVLDRAAAVTDRVLDRARGPATTSAAQPSPTRVAAASFATASPAAAASPPGPAGRTTGGQPGPSPRSTGARHGR
jgi:hypothetical protein